MRAKSLPRFVKPHEIMEGDVIRISWESSGVTHTRTGRVHRRRDHAGTFALYTKEGAELWHYVPRASKAKVTLLAVETPTETQTSLFDIEEMERSRT